MSGLKLLKNLMERKQWRMFQCLVIASFGAMLLECVGISLIFPVISVLLEPEFLTENAVGIWLERVFSIRDSRQLLIGILLLMGGCYLLKNVYLLAVNYGKTKFILNCQFTWKKKVLAGFFYAPYMKYMDCSTAELVQAVESDVDGCIVLMEKMLGICQEVLMILLLGALLLGVNGKITIGVLLLCGILFLLFSTFFKPYSRQKSIEYAAVRREFNQWLYQSVGNRKEIKAEQKEYYFLKKFDYFSGRACKIDAKIKFIQGLPKMALELCFVFCIIGVLLIMTAASETPGEALAQLSLFGIVVLRMMPSVLRLNQLMGNTFWQIPMAERTVARMKEQEEWKQKAEHTAWLPFKEKLELKEVSFFYPGAEEAVFKGASFSIPAGKIVGIKGASGAGKTTLIDMIAGLLPASAGQILIDRVPLTEENRMFWQAGVAYIPQSACLLHTTIRENILFGNEDAGDDVLWEALRLAAAEEFVKKLPDGLETIVGENGSRLSGGQGQRLVLARALYKKAQLLILDETTSALDDETERMVLESVERIRGLCTVIIISHRNSTLYRCDMVCTVENGTVKVSEAEKEKDDD